MTAKTAVSNNVSIKDLTNEEFFYGHKACAGCGGSLAVRLALKVLGERAFSVIPANCMSAVGMIYPQAAFMKNAIIAPFAATGALLSGVAAGAKALGLKDYYVVGFAGDGGTADIGLQALSGAVDRGDRVIYICYDNEAYMNTGVQKSSLTPYGTNTTTSPAGKNQPGSLTQKKNMFEIMVAHEISYAATASIGFIPDYLNKIKKAMQTNGPSYIHVMAPCPTGWGHGTDLTVELAREGVECGLWYLAEYEAEKGEIKLNRNPKEFGDLRAYLKKQSRFKHLTDQEIELIERSRDLKWERIRKNWL